MHTVALAVLLGCDEQQFREAKPRMTLGRKAVAHTLRERVTRTAQHGRRATDLYRRLQRAKIMILVIVFDSPPRFFTSSTSI